MSRIQNMQEKNCRFLVAFTIQVTILNGVMAQGCSFTYSDSSGTITSPNYPSKYSSSLHCFYTIQSSSKYSIDITFQSFSTETSHDWLQIRCSIGPAKTSPRFHGETMPPFLSFESCSQLILQFHSDASVVRNGFSLYYTIRSEITGGFIKKPSNVFFRQDPIVLSCASKAGSPRNSPWWYYSINGINFKQLTDYYCTLLEYPLGANYSTQRISSSNACNLIIRSAATNAPVSVFTCTDSKLDNASAVVTFSDLPTPLFRTNINSSLMEVVRGDEFSITCSLLPLLNSNQILQIQLSLYFTSYKSGTVYSNTSLSLSVTAQPVTLPSYTCNIHVEFLNKLSDIASNRPNLSFTTESHPVLYWPENISMIITGDMNGTILSNGSLLCYVPAYPPATYLWRDEQHGCTTTGSNIYVSQSGIYTCTATNSIRGRVYQASKAITVTVTPNALPRDTILALTVGVFLGAAVLILLLIVIILFRQRKFYQASYIKRTPDASSYNEGRIFNQYNMTEPTYAYQDLLETYSDEGPN